MAINTNRSRLLNLTAKIIGSSTHEFRLLRYSSLRLATFLLNITFIFILVEFFTLNPAISYIISSVLIFVTSYYFVFKVVFRKELKIISSIRYLLVVLMSIFITSYLIEPIIFIFKIHYLIATTLLLTLNLLIKYIALDKFVFSSKPKHFSA